MFYKTNIVFQKKCSIEQGFFTGIDVDVDVKIVSVYNYRNFFEIFSCFTDINFSVHIYLILIPSTPLVFNNSELYYLGLVDTLKLINFKGVLAKPINNQLQVFLRNVIISYSEFKLVYTDLDYKQTSNSCDSSLAQYESFFNTYNLYLTTGTKYLNEYCIESFNIEYLSVLRYEEISKTFIRKNFFKFISNNKTTIKDINASISNLYIRAYNIDLNNDLLNKLLFNKTSLFSIDGIFNFIDENTFKDFYKCSIFFGLDNFRKIIYKSANFLSSIRTDNKTIIIFKTGDYSYPDEDFCLLQKFHLIDQKFSFILE